MYTEKQLLLNGLIEFLNSSPTPYHAVSYMSSGLLAEEFQQLNEEDEWQLEPGKSYFVTRNDSSIIAFHYGKGDLAETGIRLVGAHTDSPCLKVKPQPELSRFGTEQIGVEPYGGVLLSTWFDRDLSIAGRVTGLDQAGKLVSVLVDFKKPIAVLPNLAIHLTPKPNDKAVINRQTELPPVLMLSSKDQDSKQDKFELRELLLEQVNSPDSKLEQILDYDLCFYDTNGAALVGLNSEFLVSARLDNLLSCYVGLQSLFNASGDQTAMLVCNDHEEVGSVSSCGANGPFLNDVLSRLESDSEKRARMISQSLLISADNAHAVHPNYANRHDENHQPKINDGPVIKVNSNQRYATGSESAALFRHLCAQIGIEPQLFVSRSDLGCGSTIGPITSGVTGLNTVDVGLPQWGMHSIRETAGSDDALVLYNVLRAFYNYEGSLKIGLAV